MMRAHAWMKGSSLIASKSQKEAKEEEPRLSLLSPKPVD